MTSGLVTSLGVTSVTAKLAKIASEVPELLVSAVRAELEIESTESQRRTPVDTGALRASHVVEVTSGSDGVSGAITVGGVAAPYAVAVHENLGAFHKVGQAKFLESTINESLPFLAQRIAKRLDIERLAR